MNIQKLIPRELPSGGSASSGRPVSSCPSTVIDSAVGSTDASSSDNLHTESN